jgi:hypothetical protein
MASSRKKVILRTVTDSIYPGYLPVSGIVETVAGVPVVSLLDLEGRIAAIPLATVHHIAFVRDFNLNDRDDPERLTRRTFLARPRAEGLWLRLTLTGGDIFEGLAPLDISLVDGLLDDHGIYLIPPDIRSNTQRLYIPRSVITDLQVLAVITTPSKPKPSKSDAAADQPSLFPDAAKR